MPIQQAPALRGDGFIAGTKAWTAIYVAMMTTTGTSGGDATLSANLGEHQRHVPSVATQMAPIVVPRINLRVNRVDAVENHNEWPGE